MSLIIDTGDSGAREADKLLGTIGEAIKSFGFERKDVHLLDSDLTVYSLRTAKPPDLINVVVDHKTLTVTLVEYSRTRSSLDVQVKEALEERIGAAYGTTVRFKELPCSRLDT